MVNRRHHVHLAGRRVRNKQATEQPRSSTQTILKNIVLSLLVITLLYRSFFWFTADCPEEQSKLSAFRNIEQPPDGAADLANPSLRTKASPTAKTKGADLPTADTSASVSGNSNSKSSNGGLGSDGPPPAAILPANVKKTPPAASVVNSPTKSVRTEENEPTAIDDKKPTSKVGNAVLKFSTPAVSAQVQAWGDIWRKIMTDGRCAGLDALGTTLPQVPPFGIDWPQALLNEREKAFVSPDGHNKNKYSDKYAKQCPTSKGMWGGSYIPSMECVIQYAARDMRPGDKILDWGSGCGHQGAWFEALYGVKVFGVDITQEAVDWANKNTFGKYCTADGTDLSFIEDRYFDGVFSYATLYHLPHNVQCAALKECIRVTKDGGKIFIGWNGNHIKDRPSPHPTKTMGLFGKTFWEDCLSGSARVERMEMTLEKEKVIGNWALGSMDEGAFGRNVPNYAIEIWLAGG
eukprot:g5151.t1